MLNNVFYRVTMLVACLLLSETGRCEENQFTIDTDFPCANVVVKSIEGNVVKLQTDIRDTDGYWFYWSFRVRGAEGQNLRFEFVDQNPIGYYGPAISRDECKTWSWMFQEEYSNPWFEYKFGPGEKSVVFSMAIQYSQATLERFLDANREKFQIKKSVLCKSRQGRDVELLQFGNPDNENKLGAVFLCRHHSCETMAEYVIEGIVEEVFSGTPEGRWLLENVEFFWVPFVDKDGVENGDQGKNRKPLDHECDYLQKNYPEVANVVDQVQKWSQGKRIFLSDFHCPWIRGGMNDTVFFVGTESPYMASQLARFSLIMEKYQKDGVIPYHPELNVPFGVSWNTGTHNKKAMRCTEWGATQPNAIYSAVFEVSFANASGAVVTIDSARELGHNFAKAMCEFLQEEIAHPTQNEHPDPPAAIK